MSCQFKTRTRILILSDTHSALPDPANQPKLPFSRPFPVADVAIHAGDLTSTGKLGEHERALALLKSLPAPLKIVIPGNHDLTLDAEYCSNHPVLYGWRHSHTKEDLNRAYDLYTNEQATNAGIFYIVEGIHKFVLKNGAKLTIYASGYTPEFCDWGFAYPRHVDRFNPGQENTPKHPVSEYYLDDLGDTQSHNEITIMITHGPPRGVLDQTTRGENVGCDHLATAVRRCKPILHCFGHIHEGWGSERRQWSWDRKPDSQVEFLEEKIQREDEIMKDLQWSGDQLGRHQELQQQRRTALAKLIDLHRRKLSYLDTEALPETMPKDFVPLTDDEKQSIEFVDATRIKHGLETVFVNASIMDVHYNPVQKPWVVDLMLPTATKEERLNPELSIHRSCASEKKF